MEVKYLPCEKKEHFVMKDNFVKRMSSYSQNSEKIKYMVIGGAGFIGSHLVAALLKQNSEVVIVDNLCTGRKKNIPLQAKFYKMNFSQKNFETILSKEKPQIIYHFAANVIVPKTILHPLSEIEIITGTLRLLNKVRELGVRKIIYASSAFVYGNNNKNLPYVEECIIDPITPYNITKITVENYLEFYKKTYNISYVVLRYSTVYGPGQIWGAMADYIRKLSKNKQADIWGDGSKTRDYVFIDDVVSANLLALKVPDDYSSPIFNIGTGIETSLNELYYRIAAILGRTPSPIYHPDRPGEIMRLCLNYSKAKRVLGWEPKYSLDEGLKITVAHATKKLNITNQK